ncbi:paraquat-inducible protein A [Rhodobacteraceae bacterium NNCM2]|nr:paraquat-inducible protein A [Coraliihabitans acroporae]
MPLPLRREGHLPFHHILNLFLLIAFPVSWFAPLAEAGFLPFFSGNAITVAGGVRDLWRADPALSLLVALFAVVIPYGKTLMLAAIHRGWNGPAGLIEIVGKLSMADVFLIALYIVVVKGVGIGHVTSSWGLWLFTLCVMASIWVGWLTKRERQGQNAPAGRI